MADLGLSFEHAQELLNFHAIGILIVAWFAGSLLAFLFRVDPKTIIPAFVGGMVTATLLGMARSGQGYVADPNFVPWGFPHFTSFDFHTYLTLVLLSCGIGFFGMLIRPFARWVRDTWPWW